MRLRTCELFDLARKVGDGVLFRVTQIDGQRVVAIHEANETMDQVIDKLEATGLGTVAVNGNVLILERLDDKIGDDAAIIRVHSWTKPVAEGGVRGENTHKEGVTPVANVLKIRATRTSTPAWRW